MIDLRSDTVTRPTPAMRRAMAAAEVGDDVYREDPTVNRLEETAAALVGKEAALYVPSGTMGNQIAIALHAPPGTEVVCEARAHVVEYELASMAVIAGCMPRPVASPDGILTAALIDEALRPDLPGLTRPGVIVVENTHNLAGGVVTPPAELKAVGGLARSRAIPCHMDGARIFNAEAACGVAARDLAAPFDTVMFCLSKGLCAPVGSLLAGRKETIDEARRWRKRLGGGMRQAGVLAAAGLVAMETMRGRLGEDHARARALAEGLRDIRGLTLEAPAPPTNILYARVAGPRWTNRALVQSLRARGVLCNAVGEARIRCVTHHDVGDAEIEQALGAFRAAAAETLAAPA
ncbi:MAG TPA: GntG family PLP-dependent aldolase [Candidatus Polarisedimenticolia bacterium]|nr:GntG family PLP-dependent aldolase [Candidatus Polarisedimenticolia bacterium]